MANFSRAEIQKKISCKCIQISAGGQTGLNGEFGHAQL